MANSKKALDENGVLYLWGKVKTYVATAIANIKLPSKTSDLTNDSGFITAKDVPEGAAASSTVPKMDGTAAAGTETAFARGDHVHPSDTTKVDKVEGKGLSANDYTNEEKAKLGGVEANANNYTLPDASAILQKCNSADGRYFETEYEERLKDLDEVIVLCDTLNQYINLSYKRKYISGDQCHYWAELVRPVRQKAFNWKRNDSNRAAALREAKANQELAKMGQMAQQIAEALARNP